MGTARLPPGRRLYAIGDIHGRYDLLHGALARIEADLVGARTQKVEIVFIGDYVDRGSDSAAVIETLIDLSARYAVIFLKGNHEACLLQFLREPSFLERWSDIGALPTLLSYGLRPSHRRSPAEAIELARQFRLALPLVHNLFYCSLRPYYIAGDFMFVHAGIDPLKTIDAQNEQDLLWIRQRFLDCTSLYTKIIVHGHTPVGEPDCRPNRINIDTGAFATGRLTALRIEGRDIAFV